ncbi:MAG: tRNA epoxyqueuosine(34) reductase QueG [Gammaproteobacteria bacterium RIFCSPLOWO2_02_FULL_61_13]|nr:MAG: tRNA epoxyqueuosine(34) reductase QueG [Gammaproteobacteria bacterium RIFCSPLOWO2_02_FULL_61_13]
MHRNADALSLDYRQLTLDIKAWAAELGFAQVGITAPELGEDERHLIEWLHQGRHGAMDYMERHGTRRSRPAELIPGTVRVISARLDYFPGTAAPAEEVLSKPDQAYVSRYALGRDYHKVLRGRLAKLVRRIESACGPFAARAFTDSAPVLEKALARNAGLGWIGKHTNLIHPQGGSWFFLGEIYTDLPLPVDDGFKHSHCGSCSACIDVCPTHAIVAPYELDARRCISYLTIEWRGSIPEELRPLMGNRIYGCDDCQLVCPWNRFAQKTPLPDFEPRHGLDSAMLVELFNWSEAEFLANTEGSPIRRIGYECWLRNIAVALGNAPRSEVNVAALRVRQDHPSELVREHVRWALERIAAG